MNQCKVKFRGYFIVAFSRCYRVKQVISSLANKYYLYRNLIESPY